MQTAADAAAIAAASQYYYDTTKATSAAKTASAANGFTDGTNGVKVTVNAPPTSGVHQKTPYVEVIVSQPRNTVFMGVFGYSSVNVSARAVGVMGGVNDGCIFIMAPSNPPSGAAMNLQGSFDVSAPKCGIVVNSNSPGALNFTGKGGTLSAGSVAVAGTATGQTGDSNPPPIQNVPPVSDPLAGKETPPTIPGTCSTATTLTGSVSPGCYSAANITISNATLGAGTYIFSNTGGTVQFSGTVDGTAGVTLYTKGSIDMSNGTVDFNPPGVGQTYEGLVIFADPSDTGGSLTFDKGNASGTVNGIIYAPNTPMTLHDSGGDKNGGLQLVVDLIVYSLDDQTATLSMTSYTQANPNASPLTKVVLVE